MTKSSLLRIFISQIFINKLVEIIFINFYKIKKRVNIYLPSEQFEEYHQNLII